MKQPTRHDRAKGDESITSVSTLSANVSLCTLIGLCGLHISAKDVPIFATAKSGFKSPCRRVVRDFPHTTALLKRD
jgi:hypothetical protein